MEALLKVDKLSVKYKNSSADSALVNVSFNLYKGEILGIVGESGSGKTTLANAILNVLPDNSQRKGRIIFQNKDIFSLRDDEMEKIRGGGIGIVFQEAAASFDPVFTIGYQLREFLKQKRSLKTEANIKKEMADNLSRVGLREHQRILESYPHQLSGGQLQRAAIAMAISANPSLLIADEPTSSLDVTVESQIVSLLLRLQKELNLTILFITHNLGLVDILCNRVVVLYRGKVQDDIGRDLLFSEKTSNYTRELAKSFRSISFPS